MLSARVLVSVGVAVRERRGGRRGGALKCRAGETEKVRRPDQKGLQGYVSRYLGGGNTKIRSGGVREKGWRVGEGGRAEIFILVI